MDQPVATFTFLFTDLEGSTRLWELHPQAMRTALERHDALLGQAVESCHGRLVKSTGDGLMAVFPSVFDGAVACLRAQQSLQAEPWGETGPLKVRMSLHVGEAQPRRGDFFGPAVNRAARLVSIAHGGQILLSAAIASQLDGRLPEGAGLLDLGEHRLKDLEKPERVFQLIGPGLPVDFPPLNSLDLFPNNLPVQLTHFIGREAELAEVQRLLRESRLLTLTGPGGTGKTRLSLQAAAALLKDFPQGAWLVELAPIADPRMVVQSVAGVLTVRETAGRTLRDALIDFLRYKTLLLILDNCEHLIESCTRLADDLLRACPRLKILASSRESLGIAGEVVFRVPSLSLPPDFDRAGVVSLSALEQSEAVRLFVERAQSVSPAFRLEGENAAAVSAICRRLDGIPLAIELAAARVRVLSPAQIAARLDDRFRLLTGGSRTALPRQQTLKALIDWSWELLSEAEKILLRRLSVFAGGFSLEAAESLCAESGPPSPGGGALQQVDVLDILEGLVKKSLVLAGEEDGEARYRLLETIRQYTREQLLAAGEASTLRDRHFDFYTRLAAEAEPHLKGAEMIAWLNRLEREIDNIRAALEWGLENCRPEAGHLARDLLFYWIGRGMDSEGSHWLRAAEECLAGLPLVDGEEESRRQALRAQLLAGAAAMNAGLGDNRLGVRLGEEAVQLARASGDPRALGYALSMKTLAQSFLQEYADQAEADAKESLVLARQAGDLWLQSIALNLNGAVAGRIRQNPALAAGYLQENARLVRQLGNPYQLALYLFGQLFVHQGLGRLAEARHDLEEGIRVFGLLKNQGFIVVFRSELAHLLRRQGDLQGAQTIYRETLPRWLELGNQGAFAHQLESVAAMAVVEGEYLRAARLLGAAEALRRSIHSEMAPNELPEYDATLNGLRQGLEEPELQSAWAEGQAMNVEQALSYALGDG